MTHRFFLKEKIDSDMLVVRDKALLGQMRRVLRLGKGDQVIFFNDAHEYRGFDYVFELKNIERAQANFLKRERVENTREPNKSVALYQSLPKKEKFEWILQHGTEIGISKFVPIVSARSEKKSISRERCIKILREAAEQSGRAIIPELADVADFKQAVELVRQDTAAKTYFANENEKENMIYGAGDRANNLFIGPEGGWDEKEIFAAHNAGFQSVSLGRLTLRAETAALVASYTLLWG